MVLGARARMDSQVAKIALGIVLAIQLAFSVACPTGQSSYCSCFELSRGLKVECHGSEVTSGDEVKNYFADRSFLARDIAEFYFYDLKVSLPNSLFGNKRVAEMTFSCATDAQFEPSVFSFNGQATKKLRINGCRLSNTNFRFMAEFERIDSIDIGNSLTNVLPDFPYVETLTAISLSNTSLSSWIPQGNTPSLTRVRLDKVGRDNVNQMMTNISTQEKLEILELPNNGLDSVPAEIRQMKSLLELELSFNPIRILRQGSLHLAASLTRLSFYKCPLTYIDPGTFCGDFSRTILQLSGTQMSLLEEEVFKPLLEMKLGNDGLVHLDDAPLSCDDCRLAWLIRDHRELLDVIRNGRCTDGGDLSDLMPEDFAHCEPETTTLEETTTSTDAPTTTTDAPHTVACPPLESQTYCSCTKLQSSVKVECNGIAITDGNQVKSFFTDPLFGAEIVAEFYFYDLKVRLPDSVFGSKNVAEMTFSCAKDATIGFEPVTTSFSSQTTDRLSISQCKLSKTNFAFMAKFSRISRVDIASSFTSELPNFPRVPSLTTISIYDTPISSWISEGSAPNLENVRLEKVGKNNVLPMMKNISTQPGLKIVDIQNNELGFVPKELGLMENLQQLFLDFNRIQVLKNGSLHLVARLTELSFRNCPLTTIEVDAFKGDFSMTVLRLDGTQLSLLEKGVFKPLLEAKLQNGGLVHLDDINLKCDDCGLAWLIQDDRHLLTVLRNGRCADGKDLTDLTSEDYLQCKDGSTTTTESPTTSTTESTTVAPITDSTTVTTTAEITTTSATGSTTLTTITDSTIAPTSADSTTISPVTESTTVTAITGSTTVTTTAEISSPSTESTTVTTVTDTTAVPTIADSTTSTVTQSTTVTATSDSTTATTTAETITSPVTDSTTVTTTTDSTTATSTAETITSPATVSTTVTTTTGSATATTITTSPVTESTTVTAISGTTTTETSTTSTVTETPTISSPTTTTATVTSSSSGSTTVDTSSSSATGSSITTTVSTISTPTTTTNTITPTTTTTDSTTTTSTTSPTTITQSSTYLISTTTPTITTSTDSSRATSTTTSSTTTPTITTTTTSTTTTSITSPTIITQSSTYLISTTTPTIDTSTDSSATTVTSSTTDGDTSTTTRTPTTTTVRTTTPSSSTSIKAMALLTSFFCSIVLML